MARPNVKARREEGSTGGEERPQESSPTVDEIVDLEPIKTHAADFVRSHPDLLDDAKKIAIASWAYRNGMAAILKKAEKALGDFGAGTIFATLCQEEDEKGIDAQAERRSNGGASKEKTFDPMYA